MRLVPKLAALALMLTLVSCVWLAQMPQGHHGFYAWNGHLSNAGEGPTAPLFIPSPEDPLPLIEVSFPGRPGTLPRRFIIDTGAPISLISEDLRSTLGLRCRPSGRPAPDLPETLCRIPHLAFGKIALRAIPVGVVASFPAVGSSETPIAIDGVLGLNVLSQVAIIIAPSRGQVQIFPSGSPFPGDVAPLGLERHQVLTAGEIGRGGDEAPEEEVAEDEDEEGAPGEISWAPILITDRPEGEAPPVVLPAAERDPWLPQGGPHLMDLATGRARSFIRPELLLWAAGDGVLATVAAPTAPSLAERLTQEILDEEAPAPLLVESTRYLLPSLALGPHTLGPLQMDQTEEVWRGDPLAAILGADLLSRFDLSLDLKVGLLKLRPVPEGTRPPTIQGRLIAWAEAALAKDQTHYPTLEEAMARFVSVGRWPDAATLAGRMVTQNPSAVSAWIVLAMNAEREGDLAEGIQLYRRLYWVPQGREAGILGASRLALLQGDLPEALRDLHSVEADDPKGRARMWRVRGQILLYSGDAEGAVTSFRRSLARGQEDAGARLWLAWMAFEEGNLESAEEHLTFALIDAPQDPFAIDLMIATLRRQNREGDIDPWLQTLRGRFPNPAPDGRDPLATARLRLLRERGQGGELEILLKEQLAAQGAEASRTPSPRQRAIALEMQARLLLAARADLQRALDLAGQAQEADPAGTRGLLVGADILRAMGTGDSRRAYKAAWERAPLSLPAWLGQNGLFVPELAPPPPEPPKPQKRARRHSRYLPDKE